MPIFAVEYSYTQATLAGRDKHRASHREWLAGLVTDGTLLSSGPYPDGSGALLLFRAADHGALLTLLAEDPFAAEDVIDGVRATEWQPGLGAFSA